MNKIDLGFFVLFSWRNFWKWIAILLRPFQWHTVTDHRVSLASLGWVFLRRLFSIQHHRQEHVDQWLQYVVDFVLIVAVAVNVLNVISSLVVILSVEVLFQNVVHCSFLSMNSCYERMLKMVFLNLRNFNMPSGLQGKKENIVERKERGGRERD